MKVSLVMGTLGRGAEVAAMISTLKAQSSNDFELIVVDQNADDRLVPMVEEAERSGMKIRHERMRKAGLSAARNRGIALARHEIVGFPDDDCWYEHDVIEAVLRAFKAGDRVDGLVGNWVERDDSHRESNAALSLDAWRRFRDGHASSITLFFRRRLFDEIGGFDERLGVGNWFGAAEETDFVLRALQAGARLHRCEAVRVHHKLPALRSDLRSACAMARQRARGTGAMYAKHDLSVRVIIRGLIAPIAVPLLSLGGLRAVVQGACTSLGRLEGLMRWVLVNRNKRS